MLLLEIFQKGNFTKQNSVQIADMACTCKLRYILEANMTIAKKQKKTQIIVPIKLSRAYIFFIHRFKSKG